MCSASDLSSGKAQTLNTKHFGILSNPDPHPRFRLQKLVDNGPHPPPGETGAKNIIRADGRRLSLLVGGRDEDRKLEIGNKVGTLTTHQNQTTCVCFIEDSCSHMSRACLRSGTMPFL